MQKKFSAFLLIFLLALPGNSFAAENNSIINYTNTDPFHLSSTSFDLQSSLSPYYSLNGLGDIDFFYQLRDVTGESFSDASRVAGPQWFATVYENYSTVYNSNTDNNTNANRNNLNTGRTVYRRTLGGEDAIHVSTIGDIIDGFNFVFIEEPQPYAAWLTGFNQQEDVFNALANYYDVYPDPLESLCIVTTDGFAKINVDFANPYARHFPFWWNWRGNTSTTANYSWWQNLYNWTNLLPNYTTEPVAYIYNPSDGGIYAKSYVYSTYSKIYDTVTSGDYVYINYTDGTNLYITSGDVTSSSYLICSGDTTVYKISGDAVYNSSNGLVYTLESAWNDNCVYVCSPRYVDEAIAVQGFDGYDYTVNVSPSNEQSVASTEYLNTTVTIRGDADDYGSRLGYITFRQRASFADGYRNYREASSMPVVFVNVSNGNAAENPLMFDMTITDPDDDKVIKRVKFKWNAQTDLLNQNLGTFFTMMPVNDASSKIYNVETKITNRTGTRYMLYRYDRSNPGSNNLQYNLPQYWKYDLTEDVYGTLPKRFLLDPHSQIAPGLVTAPSFRLYEYNQGNPKNLWLNYKRVGGMLGGETLARVMPDAALAADDDDEVTVQTFSMAFRDVKDDSDNTENEIQSLIGRTPVMNDVTDTVAQPYYTYIDTSAMNAFRIDVDLTGANLFGSVYDVVTVSSDTNSDDEVTIYTTEYTGKTAVMPIRVRLKIPRTSQLLKDIWEQLDAAENSRELFNIFNRYATVYVRSSAAAEYDADLFKAVGSKGTGFDVPVTAADCVEAFLYDNYLNLEFMVFMTDAVSKKTEKTAFVEIFKDDGIPYILIGDGNVDAALKLDFYVAEPGVSLASTEESTTSTTGSSSVSGSSSGSCSSIRGERMNLGVFLILGLSLALRIRRKE